MITNKEMKKLIRAINEYGKTGNCGPFETCRLEPATDYVSSYLVLSWDDNGEGDWKVWVLEVPRLISKEYGFIKWLIENDRIDFEDQAMQYAKSDLSKFFTEWKDINGMSDDYVMVLMLLSIQDSPIDFLISILK